MMPLSVAAEGEHVRIRCVDCGKGVKKRLCELGLFDGTEIEIVKNERSGPMILKVKESKLVLGRGQAEKITVE